MKIGKAIFVLVISLGFSTISLAGDICATKPEAESVKNPLPVKYQNLKAQNEELRKQLEECKGKKEKVKAEISRLETQISDLESEKARLQMHLIQLPSKESLEEQIKNLERK